MKSTMLRLGLFVLLLTPLAITESRANCQDGNVYPITQCGEQAWFAPLPADAGPANSAAWWQLGYGHRERTASDPAFSAADGTGWQGPTRFGPGCIGNDSGALDTLLELDLVDASLVGGPAGALCFGPFANWINTGSDGCADNSKFTTGVTPFPLAFDDNRLNPYFGPVYGPGILSDVYQLDHPMGVLLTEGTGKYFAAAFFATLSRQRNPNDASAGSFDLSMVTNGDPNPLVQGRHNIIPWQLVPQPFISVVGQIEDVGTSPRIVTAVITPPRVIHDGSVRPSGAPAAVLGGAPGVGVLDQAGGDPRSLIRFVFENAPLTVAGVCGTYLPVHEVPIGQATTTFIVPADTCLRMVTHFGRRPQTQTCSQNNASVALTGDIGYNVSSVEVFIGEGLASDGLAILSARRQRGQSVAISFRTASELNVMQLALFGRDARGRERLLATLQPRQGSTGLGDTYEVTLTKAQLRGARSLYVVAQPSGTRSADVVIK